MSKYSQDYINAYIIEHYRIDMKAKAIGEHLGQSEDNVHKTAYRLRQRGLLEKRKGHLGTSRKKPIGSERTFTLQDGRTQTYVKTEKGWRYKKSGLPRKNASKKVAEASPKKPPTMKDTARTKKTPKSLAQAAIRQSSTPVSAGKTKGKAGNIKKNGAKQVFYTTKNPDVVNIRQETEGKWVRIDSKTMVFKRA